MTKAVRPQEHLDEAVAHITDELVKRLGYRHADKLTFLIIDVLECYEGFLEAKGLVGELLGVTAPIGVSQADGHLPDGGALAPVFKAGEQAACNHPRHGHTTGIVQQIAKDGSWAKIYARTGRGGTYGSRKYSGEALAAWKPVAADAVQAREAL